MRYALDTEFIDTPECSALISLAIAREDGAERYYEFDYPKHYITPWLAQNVIPHLKGPQFQVTMPYAAVDIRAMINKDKPEFWCLCGGHDWYFLCRLFGGFMRMPPHWPHTFRDFHWIQTDVPSIAGPEHDALNDARSLMHAIKLRKTL